MLIVIKTGVASKSHDKTALSQQKSKQDTDQAITDNSLLSGSSQDSDESNDQNNENSNEQSSDQNNKANQDYRSIDADPTIAPSINLGGLLR